MLLTAAIGAALVCQGWKSRLPNGDVLTTILSAQDFLETGRFPDRGVLTSFASFAPPGATWLMIPGVLLFSDPRLFEYIGSLTLYSGTLLGVFLLARVFFGARCAILAVALYGLSEIGLSIGGSLWQRFPIHFFYVWMVYWTTQWVIQKSAAYLAAALITWAAGMYVFMEIAPAVFILPAIWLLYRPTLRLGVLLLAALVIVTLWYPYLQFEYQRGFADLKSQVLRQKILPAEFSLSWCNPALVLHTLEGSADASRADQPVMTRRNVHPLLTRIWAMASFAVAASASNFQHSAALPANSVVLTGFLILSLILLAVSAIPFERARRINYHSASFRYWFTWFAGTLIVGAMAANELIISRYFSEDGVLEASTLTGIRAAQIILVLSGCALLLLRGRVGAILNRLTIALTSKQTTSAADVKIFLLSLLIPWAILLVLVENAAHLERFLWLWPLQVIAIAALATYVPWELQASPAVPMMASLLLGVMIVGNPLLLSRVKTWYSDGWFGSDPDQVRGVQFIVSRLEGRKQVAIGYQTFIWRFMAMFHSVDSRYKVGAEFDLLFKDRHEVSNTNDCGEGISPKDEFRIVQTTYSWTDLAGKGYFEIRPDNNFVFVKQFGAYQVLQRQ